MDNILNSFLLSENEVLEEYKMASTIISGRHF